MTRLALFLTLSLAGCGPSRWYHGATSFDDSERASIEAGAHRMNDLVGDEPLIVVWSDDDADNRILRAVPPTHGDVADGEFLMLTADGTRTIYLHPRLTGERLAVVATHEWGHAHGLGHHVGPGLMNGDKLSGAWTDVDAAACRKLGKCQ